MLDRHFFKHAWLWPRSMVITYLLPLSFRGHQDGDRKIYIIQSFSHSYFFIYCTILFLHLEGLWSYFTIRITRVYYVILFHINFTFVTNTHQYRIIARIGEQINRPSRRPALATGISCATIGHLWFKHSRLDVFRSECCVWFTAEQWAGDSFVVCSRHFSKYFSCFF